MFWIFANHIPGNGFSWLSPRNYGLSDSAEIFVFLAGYSAALAYTSALNNGWLPAIRATGHRALVLFNAHLIMVASLLTFMLWLIATHAEVLRDAAAFAGLPAFGDQPPLTRLLSLITLQMRPANMDILPLYVVLLLASPYALAGARRAPFCTLAGALALWLAARLLGWNIPDLSPSGQWVFNPFAWQLLFVVGMLCASHRTTLFARLHPFQPLLASAAASYLVLSGALVYSWHTPEAHALLPAPFIAWLYPISKPALDPLRILHFLSLAYLVALTVPADAHWLRTRWTKPFVLMGRQALPVFCVGVLCSFAGHLVLATGAPSIAAQLLVTVTGGLLLWGTAILVQCITPSQLAGSVTKLR